MARAAGAVTPETTGDGTQVIAANPALKLGPIDDQGRFTGVGVEGLKWERRWTTPGVHPYDEIEWELRSAEIKNESGKMVFEQKDIEVPAFWSQLATNVVVSKYFRGHIGTPQRERSVKQLIDRVVNSIAGWAATQKYFATDEDLLAFKAELTHLLVHQKMSFNSPVWFNVGVEERPQCSACFINSVRDDMGSIMDLAKTEAILFKFGIGIGRQPEHPSRRQREALEGRRGQRPRLLHARPGRVRRRHQERWHHAARGKDGHPQRRPPRRRRFHRLQGQRGEEGVGAHRGGL